LNNNVAHASGYLIWLFKILCEGVQSCDSCLCDTDFYLIWNYFVFLIVIYIAGWTIERDIEQGSQCRIKIVFGSGAWTGNLYIMKLYTILIQVNIIQTQPCWQTMLLFRIYVPLHHLRRQRMIYYFFSSYMILRKRSYGT